MVTKKFAWPREPDYVGTSGYQHHGMVLYSTWMAVEKRYEFDRAGGKASLLDLFEGRRQLIVYRAFFESGVFGWPEHAWGGCSLGADQVAHPAHLNARDTTLTYASRAPQSDIARLKA